MDPYVDVLRPLLFRLNPDDVHALARLALKWPATWRLLAGPPPPETLATNLAGIRLATPIGLAPGFDKSGELLPSLAHLGFGYLTVGSITKAPRWGNPFPRLVRYPEKESLANSMGLPNPGLAAAVENLKRAPRIPPVIASVAGFSVDELLECAAAVEPHVAAVEIGLVCPNTTETERLEEMRLFTELVAQLAQRKTKPVFVKLPPHHDDGQKAQALAMVDACVEAGIDGVTAYASKPTVEPRLGVGRGSLAGRAVFQDALRIVGDVADRAQGRLAIKGAGGIFTGADARRLLDAGATTVELYSAFIYRGWNVARSIAQELAETDWRSPRAA
ncbi:MAG TPA: dihydroorotate dehydrogenase 2 [Chloroflexota bacterium]|nr:dihydroorotate dehydrogenase 2 [Chloroflexota bacterium]